MTKQPRQFRDPNPSEVFEPKTSAATEAESNLIEKFDALSPDRAEFFAGLVVRATVNVARYRRSIEDNPQKTDHYERLIRCASYAINAMIARHQDEGNNALIADINELIDGLDWSECELRPALTHPDGRVPYAGTEPKWEFNTEASALCRPDTRIDLPA